MPNDMPINIGLNAAEFRLVQVMRRFLRKEIHDENSTGSSLRNRS